MILQERVPMKNSIKNSLVYRILLLTLFTCGFCFPINAQEIKQSVQGQIIDPSNFETVVGANVSLLQNETRYNTLSDEQGYFYFENIALGRYEIEISHISFENHIVKDLLLTSSRVPDLYIELTPRSAALKEVTLVGKRVSDLGITPSLSTKLSLEEGFKMPATFNDFARQLVNYPEVYNVNDQANHISVRGFSPSMLKWNLEGAEILNPNHLSNAGTLSDLPVQYGGGVNMISAQLLSSSNFHPATLPGKFNNAIGAILDLELRNGDKDEFHYTAQANFVGFDLSAEGPLSRKNNASFIINYRYSFTGLINALGVDFGGEEISFQDLAFQYHRTFNKGQTLKLYSFNGTSANSFIGKEDINELENEKQLKDIFFKSKNSISGLQLKSRVGSGVLNLTCNVSLLNQDRNSYFKSSENNNSIYDQRAQLFSSLVNYKITFNKLRSEFGLRTNIGNEDLVFTNQLFDLVQQSWIFQNDVKGNINYIQLYPYANFIRDLNESLSLSLHLGANYLNINSSFNLEPRLFLSWSLNNKSSLELSSGIQSAKYDNPLYITTPDIGIIRSFSNSIAFISRPSDKISTSIKPYFQYSYNLAADKNNLALNLFDNYNFNTVNKNGKAFNYGLSTRLSYSPNNDFQINGNITVYNAVYKTGSEFLNQPFNGNFLSNISLVKEWQLNTTKRQNIFGLSLSGVYSNGTLSRSINLSESIARSYTVYNNDISILYPVRLKNYFNTSMRLYYRINKPKYSSLISLDIQNLSNNKNVSNVFYDQIVEDIVTANQLGILPVLGYRIEF